MLTAAPTAGLMKECVRVGSSGVTPRGSGYLAIEGKGLWLPAARETPKKDLLGVDKFTALDGGTQPAGRSTIPASLWVRTLLNEPQTV